MDICSCLFISFGWEVGVQIAAVETQQTPFCHLAAKISNANPQGASFLSARFKVPKGTVEDFNVFFLSRKTPIYLYISNGDFCGGKTLSGEFCFGKKPLVAYKR